MTTTGISPLSTSPDSKTVIPRVCGEGGRTGAAIDTGRVELKLARRRMSDLLEEREAFQVGAAEAKQIELEVAKGEARHQVMADRLRLGEVPRPGSSPPRGWVW